MLLDGGKVHVRLLHSLLVQLWCGPREHTPDDDDGDNENDSAAVVYF